MANYYTTFSFEVDELKPEEADWLEKEHQKLEDEAEDMLDIEWSAGDFRLELRDERKSAWFHVNESGNPDAVADFLQEFLTKWRPTEAIGFEWAATCSSQRTDGFGGGAFFVTADEQRWTNTTDWLRKQQEAFNKKEKA